jgi:ABC-2 type transport system ATP-binding protein
VVAAATLVTDGPVVIDVAGVTKDFTSHVAKSIKERLVTIFTDRGRGRRQFRALDGVDLEVRLGETVGLIGHNGSGKSTLLKILGGILDTSSGRVRYRGRLAALLELGAGFHPDLTGRENIYLNASVLGLTKEHTDAVFDDIVAFSGLETQFIDSQVKFYSSGMYVRLAFAVAVHSDPDILLVDEVLAVGDERFQVKCLAKIRDFQAAGKTIVLVSHDAEQVADVCSRTVVLDHGKVIFDGDVESGLHELRESYERARAIEAEAHGGTGIGPVEVLGVDVLDGKSMTPVSRMHRGSDLIVRIDARVNEATEWVAGFTLENSRGQYLYSLNSTGVDLVLPSVPGRYSIDFRVEGVNLGSDRIIVSAAATLKNGTPLHSLIAATEFDVDSDPHGAGFLQFPASGAVTTASGT